MLLLLVTILIYGTLCTASFLVTYWVFTTIKQASGGEEPSINGIITMQFTSLIQNIITASGDMVSIVTGRIFGFISNIQNNLRIYLQIFILILLILSYSAEKELFLSSIDQLWRCGVHPFFNSILFSILQAGRLLYGGLVPVYNLDMLIIKQAVSGTQYSMFLCAAKSVFESLVIIINIVVTFFQSITIWTGVGFELSMENNILFNELNVAKLIMNIQRLVLKQSEITGCICGGLVDVFEFFYIAFRQDELAFGINHLINIPVSLVQALMQVIPPWSSLPLGMNVVTHVNGFIFFMAKWADQTVMKWIIHLISLFDDKFELQGVPEEFAFTILGRFAMAYVHVLWTGYRGVLTLAVPFSQVGSSAISSVPIDQAFEAGAKAFVNEVTKGDYMLRVFSMDQAMEQYQMGSIGVSNLFAWCGEVVYEVSRAIVQAVDSGESIALILPSHKHIVCNNDLDRYFDNVGCGIREVFLSVTEPMFIFYSLVIELLFKSIINQEQDVGKTLQRYDGISFPRTVDLVCEYRASINYDLTAKECRCDPGLGEYRRPVAEPGYQFGRPHYDPYCGQPNLQVNYFGQLERMADYFSAGWYENLRDIIKAYALFLNEARRTALKAALNIVNIVKNEYFEYKVNCGYGLTSAQIRTWWIQQDDTPTFEEKLAAQRAYFKIDRVGKSTPRCDGEDELPYMNIVANYWSCKLIDEAILDIMCLTTSNPTGKQMMIKDSNQNLLPTTVDIPRCTTFNRAGCECNPLLANYCTGHTTNDVADDLAMETEEDCTGVYTGGTWYETSCKLIAHPANIRLSTQMFFDVTSDAKCRELKMEMGYGSMDSYEFNPPHCSDDDPQTLNGEIINVTTKAECTRVTTPGNWTGGIEPENQCACIRNFPDSVMEYSQNAFDNVMLNKIHSPDVAVHWCNTFWAEWILFSVQRYADVIERAAGVFHPAYESDADTGNAFCESATFTIADTNILRFPRYKFERNKDQFDRLKLTYTENSCSLHGTTDLICSTGLTIRNVINTVVNEIRMIVMSFSKILDGDFSQIKLSVSERVCDAGRALAALSSILPSLIPDSLSGTKIQIGLSKMIYSILHAVVSALDIVSVILDFLDKTISNQLDWTSGDGFPVFDLVFTILNVAIDWVRLVLRSIGDLLNAIHDGAGAGLYTVDRIIEILQVHLLNEAVLEILGLVVKIFFELFEFLTSGNIAGGIGAFFIDFFTLIGKIVLLLVKQVAKVMSLILDMMGPAGALVRKIQASICDKIEGVMCWATGLLGGSKEACKLGCGGGRRRHLFSSGNETSKFQDIVYHVSRDLDWNGTSNCDMFIHAYKNYKWDDLRPIEHIELVNCIEHRVMVMQFNKEFNISLPEDILYNWERKWQMAYKAAVAAVIYVEHRLGKLTTKEMLHQLKSKEVDFAQYLPLISATNSKVKKFFTMNTFYEGMEYTFRQYDPEIEKGNTPMSSVYRLYSISGKAFKKVHDHVRKQNLRRQFSLMYSTIQTHAPQVKLSFKIPTHLSHAWESYNKLRVPPKSSSKIYAKNLILKAAGVVTDITPCTEKEDTYVCLNCVVLDNFLNVVIEDGIQMSYYYDMIYSQKTIPSFIDFWTNSTAVAWREDVGTRLAAGFTAIGGQVLISGVAVAEGTKEETDKIETPWWQSAIYTDFKTYKIDIEIEPEEGSQVDSAYDPNEDPLLVLQRPRLKLFSAENNQTITFRQRSQRDWEWFLFEQGWNPFYIQPESKKRPSFFYIIVEFLIRDYYDYVPFFERSLRYYLWQPIQDCPNTKVYCQWNTFEDRQSLISDGFTYSFTTILVLYGLEYLTGLPVFTMVAPYILLLFAFIYMFTVYGYTYKCIPSLPNCLFEDLYAFIHDKLFPACFCYYLPGLAKTCNPDTCFLCARVTEFSECRQLIPMVDKLGLAWGPIFWIRYYLPDVFIFFYQTSPFSWVFRNNDSLVKMAQSIIEGFEVSQVEKDCLSISYFDIILAGVGIWLLCQGMSIIAPLLVRGFQHLLQLLLVYTTMIYSMIVSLELQTVMVKEED